MGSKQVLSGVTVTWDDTKYNQTKKTYPGQGWGQARHSRSNNDEFTLYGSSSI
jgi:hypothetical protein